MAEVHVVRRDMYLLIGSVTIKQKTPTEAPQTLWEALSQAPESSIWSVQQLQHSDQGRNFVDAMRKGDAIAVSDGSYGKNRATSAFILSSRSQPHMMVTAVNEVAGMVNSLNSYRVELSGIYGTLILIRAICQLYKVHQGHVTLALDGDSAL